MDLVSEGQKLVNGSVGVIIGWAPRDQLDIDQKAAVPQQQHQQPPPVPLPPEEEDEVEQAKKAGLIKYKEVWVDRWLKANKHRVPVVSG